jgi:hypothetical protein
MASLHTVPTHERSIPADKHTRSIPTSRLKRSTVERELVARAFHDAEFLRQLVANPRSCLEEILGFGIPNDVQVEIHQETMTTIHVVLPAAPESPLAKQEERLRALWESRVAGAATAAPRELPELEWTRERLERSLLQRAAADAGFKSQLISSPAQTLAEFLGIEIPADYHVHIHEESPNRLHLVLPNNPNVPEEVRYSIRDEKLKAVVFSCVDACLTAAGTVCGTCTLVTYCTH